MDASRRAFLAGRPVQADAHADAHARARAHARAHPQAQAQGRDPAARIAVSGRCLARHGVECRLCADVCEARALRFTPARGGIPQLTIQLDRCSGCAECVALCPVGALSMVVPVSAGAHLSP